MQEKIFFKNISGQNYFITEINKVKPVSFDPKRIWEIEKSLAESHPLIKSLFQSGKFVEVNGNEPLEEVFVVEKSSDEKNKIRDVRSLRASDGEVKKEILEDKKNIEDVFSFGNIEEIPKESPLKSEDIKKENNSLPNVWWRGPADDMGGYGKMNHYCLKGLGKKMHIELDMHNIPSIRNTIPLSKDLQEMLNNKVDPKSPAVWAIMPPKFPTRQGKIVYFTMLESGTVHPSFLKKLNYADEVWVPSQSNFDILSNDKEFKSKLIKIPLGVDTSLYKPIDRSLIKKEKFNIKTKGFVFLSVFGWSLRKGNDVLLKSYLKSFSKNDDVTLLIVSRLNGSSSVENIKRIRDEISSYIKTFSKNPENHPHIVHVGVGIPEADMPSLYNLCDCFVLPSRGEGYGLPMVEAGACSLPVISTRCGGQLEFLNDSNSYLIDIDGYGVEKQEIKDISSYYENVTFAVLGQKAIDQLSETMSHVYINRRESKERGEALMNYVREKCTWDLSVEKIYERLTAQ